jgi:cytochrome c1
MDVVADLWTGHESAKCNLPGSKALLHAAGFRAKAPLRQHSFTNPACKTRLITANYEHLDKKRGAKAPLYRVLHLQCSLCPQCPQNMSSAETTSKQLLQRGCGAWGAG